MLLMSLPTFDKVSQKSQRTQIHFLSDVFLFFRRGGDLSFSRFFFVGGGGGGLSFPEVFFLGRGEV